MSYTHMNATTLAHATWFVDGHHPFDMGFAGRPLSVLAVTGAAAVALLVRRAASSIATPQSPRFAGLGRLGPLVPRLLAASAGVALMGLAVRGQYLAPSIPVPSGQWGLLLIALEAVIGIGFVLGVRVRAAALLLMAAGPLGMVAFGGVPVLERIDLLGVAVFLALLPPGDRSHRGRVVLDVERVRHALFGLRLLVGSALVLVAFTEKLMRPELSLAFLAENPMFNLGQLLGLPVSDELFIQATAGIEILIGLLLISGAFPRLIALAAAVPFTVPILLLGIPEVLGHLPIYGALLALLVFGSRPDTAQACSWLPSWPRGSELDRELVPSA